MREGVEFCRTSRTCLTRQTVVCGLLIMESYMGHKKITVAVAGQPNCGKSTMFNVLTGSSARVGNYPGITVERMEGRYKTEDYKIKFIDLPGTYSLTSYSMDEVVARNVILDERPDIVLCMIDATTLERSLYLVVQLLEIGRPIVVGLNMMDEVKKKGIQINAKKLSELLQVPFVECVARKGIGKTELIDSIIKSYETNRAAKIPFDISYGPDLDPALDEMVELIEKENFMSDRYPSRWLAVKYMEEDEHIIREGDRTGNLSQTLKGIVERRKLHTEKTLHTYPEAIVADYRYGLIQSMLKQGAITRNQNLKYDLTEKIDKILTHRLLGPIILVGMLYFMFLVTFKLGNYPKDLLQNCFDWLGNFAAVHIHDEQLRSLVVSGVIGGVGAVLSFAPLILIMFAILCFLEDLGYMARAAYMLDKIFKIFGLHGTSVMPFILAGGIPGGCAVPGVMTARTIKSPKERIATILTAPFMACGAKTTVFLMLAEVFFPGKATNVMLLLTLFSWLFALVVAKILRSTVIKGPSTPFIMELPPYRIPTPYGIVVHTLDRVWQFVKKAGTIIFAISIIIWVFISYPQLPKENKNYFDMQRSSILSVLNNGKNVSPVVQSAAKNRLEQVNNEEQSAKLTYSYAGRLSIWMESITKYAGIPWQANVALIGGIAAKEVIISSLSTAYSLGAANEDSTKTLSSYLKSDPHWTLPAVMSLLIFVLLYSPCFATIVAMARETSWKYAICGTFGSIVVAYFISLTIYQIGSYLMR